MLILLASSQILIFIHCYLALHDNQSRMKCPDLKESEMYNLKPWVYYMALAITSLAELAIYIWIGSVVSTQDNSMKGLLSKASLRRRNRKNAITFGGHFIHFSLDWLAVLLWTLSSRGRLPPGPGLVLVGGVTSLITIAFSDPLKNELFLLLENVWLFTCAAVGIANCLMKKCCMKDTRQVSPANPTKQSNEKAAAIVQKNKTGTLLDDDEPSSFVPANQTHVIVMVKAQAAFTRQGSDDYNSFGN